MTYKESLAAAMQDLAKDPKVRFIGYGVKYGGQGGGSFKGINPGQLIETPVAENLMMGIATGMALAGLLPVVYFERMDFILNALDAIVNHLDKMATLSRGEFKPRVIIRVVVGNKNKPLHTGATHTQDFSDALQSMVTMPVVHLLEANSICSLYRLAHIASRAGSVMLVEYKDLI